MQVSLQPTKKIFQITSIFNAKDERIQYAKAGENVKIKVKNLEEEDIKRGMIVCNAETNPPQVCYEF